MPRRIGAKRRDRIIGDILHAQHDLVALAEAHRLSPIDLAHWVSDPQNHQMLRGLCLMADVQTQIMLSRYRLLAATRLIADEEHGAEYYGTFMGQEGGIDIGGYRLPPSLLNELEEIELARDAVATARNVVVVNFSSRASVPREYVELCEKLTCTTGTGKAINFPGRPFWVTASRYDPRALVEKTIQVMDEHRVVA